MNTKKMIIWLITVLLLTAVFAGAVTMQVSAGTFTTTEGCKDLVNEGIEFKTSVGIVDPVTEDFRDRILVEILAPDGLTYNGGTKNVTEVSLYAASDGTEYQCQQLTTDPTIVNSFSCNSFPAGGTISSVHVTFIPKFDSGLLVAGDYTIKITEMDLPKDVLLSGTATLDATSTSCAQNQGTGIFTPDPTTPFIYNTNPSCAGLGTQTIKFLENTTSPFKIVNFPLGESINPARFKLLITPESNYFSYKYTFNFLDNDLAPYTLSYSYTAGTTATPTTPSITGDWAHAKLPITLTGGTLEITPTVQNQLPTISDFTVKFYYENIDPTLGYENSMFHFTRNMSVQFADYCKDNQNYAMASTSYDYCKSSKQSFYLSFLDDGGNGITLKSCPLGSTGWCTNLDIIQDDLSIYPDKTNMYFGVLKCTDATCAYKGGTGSYVSSVVVNDRDYNSYTWGTDLVEASTRSRVPMRLYQKSPSKPFALTGINFVADGPGTYYISGFATDPANVESTKHLELYVVIPQYDSDLSCYTPGNDGRFEAAWNGCNEDFDTERIEFKAVDEKYAFISNYSNKTMTFTLSPSDSSMPTTVEMSELYCEWQILADGYSSSGGSCGTQKIVVPPYTRAIVTGGKFYLYEKPKISDTNQYLISYLRAETGNDMTLIMDLSIKECKQEAIPDTGYSLRSPQKMEGASKSDIIFTGNSIQIPAIGLGMETPIPIVHVYYIDKAFENGWDLTMLGGYVGELEGGAYIPYSGNAVLTGHYYSQGVFVNLSGLHLEDEIIVYATDGMKYIYKVNNSFYTKPSDVYQLFQPNGEKSLTLVTCDSYNLISDEYENRYVVMAVLDHAEPYEQ
ncbi:MAG: sortase [Flexilinea sp.]